jgi:alpha-amylase
LGVLLRGFFFAPGPVTPRWRQSHTLVVGPSRRQAHALRTAGFSAIWLPPRQKGASGSFSSGYDEFDDCDLGSKAQRGTIRTWCGTREQLKRCAAVMRANGIDVYIDVENQRDGDYGHFNFAYVDALRNAGKGLGVHVLGG